MNNREYWSRRFEDLKNEQMKRAELTAAQLKKLYEQALRDAQDEVLAWYQRYARENNLSLQEARKQLDTRELKAFHLTLEEFKRLAKQKNLSPEYRRMLDNASIRVRLDRSQALMIKLRDIIEKLAKEQQVRMEEVLKKTYEDSYYKAAYETQKVTGYAPLNGIQEETVRKVLSKPWAADGRDFSARIWGQRDQLVNALQIEVTRCLISHKGTGTMAKRIAKRFNTSFSNASRLVETEVAYFQERGRLDTFAALGVKQVRLLAVLDNRTSETCQELDGKIVALKDAEPGVTTPPFHCYCRTTIVPVSEFDTEDSNRAARDPLTGKTVQVPGDLTYKEWYNKYIKKDSEPDVTESLKAIGVTVDLSALPDDIRKANLSETVAVARANPKLLQYIKQYGMTLRTGNLPTAFGQTEADPRPQKGALTVRLNAASFQNMQHIQESVAEQARIGFKMPAAAEQAVHYTLSHELGHALQFVVLYERTADEPAWGIREAFTKQAAVIRKEVLKCAKEIDATVNTRTYKQYLSRYGQTNDFEFFAECHANMRCGAPNVLGKALKLWLERWNGDERKGEL